MTFVLKRYQDPQIDGENTALQRLNQLIFYKDQAKVQWLKYFQNFYCQSQSYFILVSSHSLIKQNSTSNQQNRQNIYKIKKILPYPNQSYQNQQSQNKNQKNPPPQKPSSNQQIQFIPQQQFNLSKNRIIAANFIHENALIVMQDPFQLFFITQKTIKPIKIILENPHQFQNIIATFSFETNDQEKKKQPYLLTLYAYDQLTNLNKILNINLMTFEIKEITQAKDYSPKPTKNHFQMFHDDRLYIFGGLTQQNKQMDELLWSFDVQKGYWFALQMKYQQFGQNFDYEMIGVYDSGKIVFFKENNFFLLEIYQCKITRLIIEGQENFKQLRQKQKIEGMAFFQKKLYFYNEKKFLKKYYSLQKQKKAETKTL